MKDKKKKDEILEKNENQRTSKHKAEEFDIDEILIKILESRK